MRTIDAQHGTGRILPTSLPEMNVAPGPYPLVSVVTPFYNTAAYLSECIESVLRQTYAEFEYILADNCSTDGSGEIAESYARQDSRIRLIRYSDFVAQLPNYNRALREVSESSQYCKIVQADDCIFPECLEMMVQAFGQNESTGLVVAYRLEGNTVNNSGYPYKKLIQTIAGKEFGRWYFLNEGFPQIFGSQTTVMYRSSIVRSSHPFFDESLQCADLKKCVEIISVWDLGFVHQVLSFTRSNSDKLSITSSSRPSFYPFAGDYYVVEQLYANKFLEQDDAVQVKRRSKEIYYRTLAKAALRFRGLSFWRYHRSNLKAINSNLDWTYLALQICITFLWTLSNPGVLLRNFLYRKESKRRLESSSTAMPPPSASKSAIAERSGSQDTGQRRHPEERHHRWAD
jgi:glycosyltransferase involved in cell wall biosynthesis